MEELCLSIGDCPQARAACKSSSEPAVALVRLRIGSDDVRRFQELYVGVYDIGLPFEAAQELLSRLLCLLAVAQSVSPVVMLDNDIDYNTIHRKKDVLGNA